MQTFEKDPHEELDFAADLSEELAKDSDTIETSTWTVPTGLEQRDDAVTGGVASVFLTGGTDGSDYIVVNTVTTAAGRVHETAFLIQVREKASQAAATEAAAGGATLTDAELLALMDQEIAANPGGITGYKLPDGREVERMDLLRLLRARGVIEARAERQSGGGMFAKVRVGGAS